MGGALCDAWQHRASLSVPSSAGPFASAHACSLRALAGICNVWPPAPDKAGFRVFRPEFFNVRLRSQQKQQGLAVSSDLLFLLWPRLVHKSYSCAGMQLTCWCCWCCWCWCCCAVEEVVRCHFSGGRWAKSAWVWECNSARLSVRTRYDMTRYDDMLCYDVMAWYDVIWWYIIRRDMKWYVVMCHKMWYVVIWGHVM